MELAKFIKELKKRNVDGISGLHVAIAQDYKTKQVLMSAFMNQRALEKTLKTGIMHYYSTSRDKLWKKGSSSGHVQEVKEVRFDCDGDAILFKVEQHEGACHRGYKSCFHFLLQEDEVVEKGKKVFDPEEVY